jgi:hypothetical protein
VTRGIEPVQPEAESACAAHQRGAEVDSRDSRERRPVRVLATFMT